MVKTVKYVLRLGLSDPKSSLSMLLSSHTPPEAIGSLIRSLRETEERLEKLRSLKAPIVRGLDDNLYVELEKLPEDLEGLLEPSQEVETEELLQDIRTALALPTSKPDFSRQKSPVFGETRLSSGDSSQDSLELLGLPSEDLNQECFDLSGNTRVIAGDPIPFVRPVLAAVLADGFGSLERLDARVCAVLMSAVLYTDIRKFGRDIVRVNEDVTLLRKGLQAHMWGASIVTQSYLPQNEVVLLGEIFPEGTPERRVWVEQRLIVPA